ncbi:K+/H+ antiporter subunit F [Desulfurispira natronophila]|uniref:Multicomponent K+:H+ antiporter subunit F n=1 Tax=Desulfurispira natronophila TaxID=682562 RepID=A0A7W7Y386_9BACT|nr:K+/H+ antiporter subunit F [Desulfurispira natronophila]MBB5021199.1 multicomponent K+:H+ antiporter subunit F [Desulfurispira natronophila]
MLSIAIAIAFAMMTLAQLLNLYRLFKGPSLPDRILALDTMYINSIALFVLLGIFFDTTTYFEAALIVAVMGFISTVATSKYLMRGDIVE